MLTIYVAAGIIAWLLCGTIFYKYNWVKWGKREKDMGVYMITLALWPLLLVFQLIILITYILCKIVRVDCPWTDKEKK